MRGRDITPGTVGTVTARKEEGVPSEETGAFVTPGILVRDEGRVPLPSQKTGASRAPAQGGR